MVRTIGIDKRSGALPRYHNLASLQFLAKLLPDLVTWIQDTAFTKKNVVLCQRTQSKI
jgi:hypothetical protein